METVMLQLIFLNVFLMGVIALAGFLWATFYLILFSDWVAIVYSESVKGRPVPQRLLFSKELLSGKRENDHLGIKLREWFS